jgi:hypothetical protein
MKPVNRKRSMRMEVIENGKPVPKELQSAVLLDMSDRFRARQLHRRAERASYRHRHSPERQSVALAMLAVEEKIVNALWVIARQPLGAHAPVASSRCGIDYLNERSDIYSIYADAAGGKWEAIAPRPSLPSAREISLADRVQDWLLLVDDEGLRKVLVYGATSKRGDAGRQVNWIRVRSAMPELEGMSMRSLNGRYQEALRLIVHELTLARVG